MTSSRLRGLKDTTTGDTLSDAQNDQVVLETMTFPDPVIEIAVEPKTKADQEKMSAGSSAPRRRRSRPSASKPISKVGSDHHERAWANFTSTSSSTG